MDNFGILASCSGLVPCCLRAWRDTFRDAENELSPKCTLRLLSLSKSLKSLQSFPITGNIFPPFRHQKDGVPFARRKCGKHRLRGTANVKILANAPVFPNGCGRMTRLQSLCGSPSQASSPRWQLAGFRTETKYMVFACDSWAPVCRVVTRCDTLISWQS